MSENFSDRLASVIVPCYNGERFIFECISSLVSQSWYYTEIIVVDDGSTDRSVDMVKALLLVDSRVKLISLGGNRGVAFARNVGIEYSNGRYLGFCDADDIWYPAKLELQIQNLRSQRCGVVHSDYDVIDEFGNYRFKRRSKSSVSLSDMLLRNHIGNLTGLIDTVVLGKPKQLDIGHEDYLMWLQVISKAGSSSGMAVSLAGYRNHGNNISRNKIKSLLWHYRCLRFFGLSVHTSLVFTLMGRGLWFLRWLFDRTGLGRRLN